MRLRMNLLENSYDFINSSLLFYRFAQEDDGSWKIAFINLVQAIELMTKEKLRRSNKFLVFENIDKPKNTISLAVALDRMIKILELPLDQSDVETIHHAIKLRNQMMHYEIDLSINELKEKYCILFEFATSFHFRFLDGELHDHIDESLWEEEANLMELFRIQFIMYNSEKVYSAFPKEMLEAQYIEEYEINGEIYPRIKYGDEEYGYGLRHTRERCGDCTVKIGEYHVPGCDIEQCPKCKGQSISCGCDDLEYDDNEEDENV